MLGYGIAVGVIAIMIAVGGIIYGLGYAMDSRKLKEFGMTELQQSLINGVIVGVLVAAFAPGGLMAGIINNVVGSTAPGLSCSALTSTNMAICFASSYLVGLRPITINGAAYPSLLEDTLLLLVPLSITYTVIGLVSSLTLSVGVASISLSSVFHPLLAQLGYVIEALTFALTGIYAQSALLDVIAVIAVPVMLPVGIVLRTFYFTRRLGGAIMAIAIGLFAVFPLTYLFAAQIASGFSSTVGNVTTSDMLAGATVLEKGVLSSATSNSTAGGLMHLAFSEGAAAVKSLEAMMQSVVEAIAALIVEVFFIPVLSISLTIISVRELARILGSEVSFGKFDMF